MSATSDINAKFAAIFGNGKGEAGLEVGADAGLEINEYVHIPRSMVKHWAVKVTEFDDWVKITGYDGTARTARPWVKGSNPSTYAGAEGWITTGYLGIWNGSLYVRHDGEVFGVSEFHIEPHTDVDVANFITVNTGHIRETEIPDAMQRWVHATRFWAVASGFVLGAKTKEYKIVDNPTALAAGAMELVPFVFEFRADAWTASAARATSWRKSNHATGGETASGFPRRWLQKQLVWRTGRHDSSVAAANRIATSAFYIATHASGVHNVLALMAPDDTGHWSDFDPACGLITKWDVHQSVKIRMTPKTQVAGTAMVVDAVVTLKMLVKEGLSPLLTNIEQIDALAGAYRQVEEHGVAVASYASWFLDGHPFNVEKVAFNQKEETFSGLIGELAVVATHYYSGTTIAGSASLQNAAQQMGDDVARTAWAARGNQKGALSAADQARGFARIKGAASASAVAGLLERDNDRVRAAVTEYNANVDKHALALGLATPGHIDADTVIANAATAEKAATAITGGAGPSTA